MLNFNDIDLEQILKVISIDTTLISNRTNYAIDIPSRPGQVYNGFKYGVKEIKITADIKRKNDKLYKRAVDELSSILNVSSEKPLMIDNTGRLYYAVPDGDIEESKKCEGFGRITINFICYTPFAYSIDAKQYNGTDSIECDNEGTTECYPVIAIGISKESHFVQVKNEMNGKKMLIGSIPTVSLPSIAEKTDVLIDECSSTTGWSTNSTYVDNDRNTEGTLGVTSCGLGLMANNFGADGNTTWHGVSARKNLGTQIEDFQVEVYINHNSSGVNGDPYTGVDNTQVIEEAHEVVSGSVSEYYKVICTAINVRTGAGMSNKVVGWLKKGDTITPIETQGTWAKFNYNGTERWCTIHSKYMQRCHSDNRVISYTTTNKTIKNFVTTTGASLRENASKDGRLLCTIPAGTTVRLISSNRIQEPETEENSSSNTYYYQLANAYEGMWGYIDTSEVTEASNVTYSYPEDIDTADDKVGIIEIYGWTTNGEKLFKMSMVDDNPWYEFNYPFFQVGGTTFLKDNNIAPQPKQGISVSGGGDKLTVTKDYLMSGAYGDWNDFFGKIGIKRENGYWHAWALKLQDGNVVKDIYSPTMQVNGVATGKLAFLSIYIGTNKDNNPCGMSFERIEVKNLNPVDPSKKNIKKFTQGDVLKVDCFNNRVWLNDKPYNDFDIGSQFFPLEIGKNSIKITSDDTELSSSVIYNERWL